MQDRSSRPDRLRQPTPQTTIDRIEALRRQRLTGKAIAADTGVSPATVSRVLKRLGLNRLTVLEPAEPPRRYHRERAAASFPFSMRVISAICIVTSCPTLSLRCGSGP